MNIFILDAVPDVSATYHCDKHVVKMILETTQLLATACYMHGVATPLTLAGTPYKPTHKNHPCAVWARASYGNYIYTTRVLAALCAEYTHRYGRAHSCEKHILHFNVHAAAMSLRGWTNPPQCMPLEYRNSNVTLDDTVAAYRAYYLNEKQHIAKYTRRPVPSFMRSIQHAVPLNPTHL